MERNHKRVVRFQISVINWVLIVPSNRYFGRDSGSILLKLDDGHENVCIRVSGDVLAKIPIHVHDGLASIAYRGRLHIDVSVVQCGSAALNRYPVVADEEPFRSLLNGLLDRICNLFASFFDVEITAHIRGKECSKLLLFGVKLDDLVYALQSYRRNEHLTVFAGDFQRL